MSDKVIIPPSSTKIKVVIRVRPFLKGESQGGVCVRVAPKSPSHILLQNPGIKSNEVYRYKFDGCYDNKSQQEVIYEKEVLPLLDSIFNGINTTVFAYGNTGAGKTYTMQGTNDNPGIIPRVINSLISKMERLEEAEKIETGGNSSYCMTVSSRMILRALLYNEKVCDLLHPNKDKEELSIREDKNKNIFIPDLIEVPIHCAEEFQNAYEAGCRNRTTGFTKLNATSSRSHAILMVKVRCNRGKNILTGKLHLIDLAGSEDNRRTENRGVRLAESANINQSLFVLSKVVNALNSNSLRIPYRDSKLTRLLQDSLGGNSVALIIANVSPCANFYLETYNTLNFAAKSRKITNKPIVHTESTEVERIVEVDSKSQNRNVQLDKWRSDKGIPNGKWDAANKENISNGGGIATMKDYVNKKFDELRKELMSPHLKNTKAVDSNRLEKLERHIIRHSEQMVEDLLNDDPVFKAPEVPMTPLSQAEYGKKLALKGKSLEMKMEFEQALRVYKIVLSMYPTQEAVANKVRKLEEILSTKYTLAPPKMERKRSPPATPFAPYNNSLDEEDEKSDEDQPDELVISPISDLSDNAECFERLTISPLTNDENSKSEEDVEQVIDTSQSSGVSKPSKKSKRKSDSYSPFDDERSSDDESDYEEEKKEKKKPKSKKRKLKPIDNESFGLSDDTEKELLRVLNSGDKKRLKMLNGVGDKRAVAILEYREKVPFTKISDLRNVGFGDALITNLLKTDPLDYM